MNYKKLIVFSILFAIVIAVISYFIFSYLPYDCNDLMKLSDYQRLECKTSEVLGVYYWLPYTVTIFFGAIAFYLMIYTLISFIQSMLKRK